MQVRGNIPIFIGTDVIAAKNGRVFNDGIDNFSIRLSIHRLLPPEMLKLL